MSMRRCDFCSIPRARWRYRLAAGERGERLACERCHAAIQADDRELLLGRVMGAPVPRTLDERYAPVWRDRARKLAVEFWDAGIGDATVLEREGGGAGLAHEHRAAGGAG